MNNITAKLSIVSVAAVLASCVSHNPPPQNVGMANPASVYCLKIGGKLDIVKSLSGDEAYCTLPGGERIEEWLLYRRDNQQ